MMENLVIAQALGGQVRIHATDTTALVEEARVAHDMWPTSCAALGRVLIVNALMASDLKDPDAKVVITVNGHGPAGTIVTQGDGKGNVRGFIGNPEIYIVNEKTGKLNVGMAVGNNGTLTVTKDLGLKEPFSGTVAIQTGEIGDDFAYYFALSEQTPSIVAVGVLVDTDQSVKSAGGMIVQLMPSATEEVIQQLEQIASNMRPMSEYIAEGMTPEQIIMHLFEDAKILEKKSTQWHCDCSREHFETALGLIQTSDLEEMIAQDHGAEITCQYCGTTYQFSEDDLKRILETKQNVENRDSLN